MSLLVIPRGPAVLVSRRLPEAIEAHKKLSKSVQEKNLPLRHCLDAWTNMPGLCNRHNCHCSPRIPAF